jgi:putative membrane protein
MQHEARWFQGFHLINGNPRKDKKSCNATQRVELSPLERRSRGLPQFGDDMKKTTQMMCFAVLGLTFALVPSKAKAASDDDKKFLAMAAQSDQNEIALSQLAQDKATNPAVKAFAEKMVKEHTMMTESMKPFADSWGLTAPTGPDADHQKELDKLNGLSGKDFDKEYIDQMVTDHAKALRAFTTEAKDTQDVKFRSAVLKGKTMVAAHKNMAYDLKKKL